MASVSVYYSECKRKVKVGSSLHLEYASLVPRHRTGNEANLMHENGIGYCLFCQRQQSDPNLRGIKAGSRNDVTQRNWLGKGAHLGFSLQSSVCLGLPNFISPFSSFFPPTSFSSSLSSPSLLLLHLFFPFSSSSFLSTPLFLFLLSFLLLPSTSLPPQLNSQTPR